MLRLVESRGQNRAAQATLARIIRQSLQSQGSRNIGFRGGNTDDRLYSDGHNQLWALARKTPHETTIPRYWNPFGIFDENRTTQHIVVEINIPSEYPTGQVAGFFAEDEDGQLHLMHDGSVGGGRPGIGRGAFLVWSSVELVDVRDREGKVRPGIPVGRLNDPAFVGRLWKFVQKVHRFKEAVTEGALETNEFKRRVEEYDRYKREHSGRKTGSRTGGPLDYVSYHGDIVDKLFEERSATAAKGEGVFNTQKIDLFVRKDGSITEVYEIKTGLGRQMLYTAIGQLLVHSGGRDEVAKFLVLPDEEKLPQDVEASVASLGICLRRFSIDGSEVVLR